MFVVLQFCLITEIAHILYGINIAGIEHHTAPNGIIVIMEKKQHGVNVALFKPILKYIRKIHCYTVVGAIAHLLKVF